MIEMLGVWREAICTIRMDGWLLMEKQGKFKETMTTQISAQNDRILGRFNDPLFSISISWISFPSLY